MPFEARILVHGVANFVPHTDGTKLLALFPDQAYAMERGIRAPEGGEICKHHMVAQMDARVLDPRLPPRLWLTLDVAKHWIGFESDRAREMDLGDGRLDGLTPLDAVLDEAALGSSTALDRRALPGSAFDSRLLAGGFFAAAGLVGPSAEYQGPFDLGGRAGGREATRNLSSVMRIEAGPVDRFALTLLPFGAPPEEVSRIPLHPLGDTLDVWVRHFCDLDRPDPDRDVPEPGDLDADFVLNYALRENLEALLERGGGRLEVPRVSRNWRRGGDVAGKPRQCMGALSAAESFPSPMGG